MLRITIYLFNNESNLDVQLVCTRMDRGLVKWSVRFGPFRQNRCLAVWKGTVVLKGTTDSSSCRELPARSKTRYEHF